MKSIFHFSFRFLPVGLLFTQEQKGSILHLPIDILLKKLVVDFVVLCVLIKIDVESG